MNSLPVAEIDWSQIAGQLGVNAPLLAIASGFVVFALKNWFTTRLTAAIKHEYDQGLADYKRKLEIRDKAAKVAELLALRFADDQEEEDTRHSLNRLAWELYLWLPTNVARELTRCIMGQVEPREVLIAVRKELLGSDAGELAADQLAIILSKEQHAQWTAAAEAKRREDQRRMKEAADSPLGRLAQQAFEEQLRELEHRRNPPRAT